MVHSYGATEVFPPDDADVIVDNTATGATLAANGLAIVDTLFTSSTRLYASPAALDDFQILCVPGGFSYGDDVAAGRILANQLRHHLAGRLHDFKAAIDGLVMLVASVLDARSRVMLEVNVGPAELEAVCALLPCMREPTIASLHDDAGYAVKAAVPRDALPTLVPRLKVAGGSDVVITPIAQIVP